jgi:hypothetical protein
VKTIASAFALKTNMTSKRVVLISALLKKSTSRSLVITGNFESRNVKVVKRPAGVVSYYLR